MYPVKSYKPFELFYFCVIASVAIPKHEIEYKIMPMLFVDFFFYVMIMFSWEPTLPWKQKGCIQIL